MKTEIKIAKLDELLGTHLAPNEEITSYRTKAHTAVGENFGSIMLSLDVDITNTETGEKRQLHLVNKMIPDDPIIFNIFNTKITYFKEMDFYQKAVPAMLKLQQDCNVSDEDWVSNIFPKCFGARHGFGSKVDKNAAILLENLNTRGYSLRDKKTGLDMNHSRMVLEKLAYLHALPIALKKLRPAEYEENIETAAKFFIANEDGKDEAMESKFLDINDQLFRKLPVAPGIIEAAIRTTKDMNFGSFPEAVEPFVTMSHEDLWVNNVLFQADTQGSPRALAFVDFQSTRLLSPMLDFVFFMFTSVTPAVRRKQFHQLFDIYYDSFCKCLRQVNCDTNEFSKPSFLAEMDRIAGSRLFEIFNRLRVIVARKDEMVGEEWYFNVDLGGEEYLKRLEDVVLEFSERGWLKK